MRAAEWAAREAVRHKVPLLTSLEARELVPDPLMPLTGTAA